MPRRRSVRRSNGSTIRRATNQYWVDTIVNTTGTVTSALGLAFDLGIANLATDYDVKIKGATVMAVRGDIFASNVGTGSTNLDSVLVAAIGVTPTVATIAQLDPTLAIGRVRPWMWQSNWATFTLASNGDFFGVEEVRRPVDVKVRRIVPSNDDTLSLVFGCIGGASAAYSVKAHLRALIRVP